ncbi:hypothetical protein [Streptomyces fulvoviolaceus]|uniref:hypothetical protein n=1 Tax=Streptomyces fulvoviolaceus TaxID=285535 RepID=UPI0021C0D7AA|nr:hypothetical protein [Streptomyces fulvoviolaceus]MCT9078784.1 hypothetical protein [Streptomyces fulvoviolaceus]
MPSTTPGAWPVGQPVEFEPQDNDQYGQRVSEEARRHFIGDSVRQHLAEQPTPTAVRAVLRHYISDFTQWAGEVISAMSSAENEE